MEVQDGTERAGDQQKGGNPYVFIVGCPRSGTTLLKRMVDAHPQLAIPPETHWIPRFYAKRVGLTEEDFVTAKLVDKLVNYHRFAELKVDREELETLLAPGKRISYADFVSAIFDRYGRREGKRFVGDKTPTYVRRIPVLHALWPKARFVHLIRDGRDVCLSMLAWNRVGWASGRLGTFGEDPITTSALYWEWLVRLGLESRARLTPDLYYEIRYEELVRDPEGECKRLCTFLGLAYDAAMLRYHAGRQRRAEVAKKKKKEISAKKAWLPPTPGLRDWTSQMNAEDLERFEAASGELLSELGYSRSIASPSADAAAHADRVRSGFDQRPLPERW